ncbi:phosphotransferase enzyme family protein [Candidatus Bipolaricaulota bacterium]
MDSFDQLPESERIERFERLARKALAAYGLEDAELRFLGQSANVVFRVQTDEGRWALRICNPGRDRRILMRELLWLVALCRDTDLTVPEPVIMRSGDLLHSVSMPGLSGFRPCMLFRWVKGHFEDDLTSEHLRAVGAFSASLHKHAESFRWPEELVPVRVSAETVGGNVPRATLKTHYSQDDTELLRSTIPAIQASITSLGDGHDVAGVVHGDLHQWNYLFHGGEACAIDFECVQWNYYAYDIATTFSYLAGRSDFDDLKSAYVEGYTAIRPLPCDLDEHIPAFDMLRAFTMIAWILGTPRLRSDEWALGILGSAVRKAKRLLGGE